MALAVFLHQVHLRSSHLNSWGAPASSTRSLPLEPSGRTAQGQNKVGELLLGSCATSRPRGWLGCPCRMQHSRQGEWFPGPEGGPSGEPGAGTGSRWGPGPSGGQNTPKKRGLTGLRG